MATASKVLPEDIHQGKRKLHRSKEKLENMPLRQVIREATKKQLADHRDGPHHKRDLDNDLALAVHNVSPSRSKSNDTARQSYSLNDDHHVV